MDFTKCLIDWYLQHKRTLPWRETKDAYLIWLSEIILQQTRVAQGLPYYLAFAEAFPTVFDLAAADEQKVLKLWQGLGYYSRARNLHATARQVVAEYKGVFPGDYNGLLKLKGVGDYTAAAIASFAYDEKVPAVDGNVFRVLSRYFDIEEDIAAPKTRKIFRELALELIPDDNPALFNQAIMEFGALQCVPRNPDCGICPLNNGCLALQKNIVNLLPVKNKKAKVTKRFLNYIVPIDDFGNTIVQNRLGKGIWRNLNEFPLHETECETNGEEILVEIEGKFFSNEIESVEDKSPQPIIHKLTHQHLSVKFLKVKVKGILAFGIDMESVYALPFPIVIHNFIEREFPAFAEK